MRVDDDAGMRRMLSGARRIAVLGIKPESRASAPAYYVPAYLAQAGYEVIPVPAYYPEVTEILGRPVFRQVSAIPGHVDIVEVFRKSEDIPPHLSDLLAAKPGAVWFQSGIWNDDVEAALIAAGIDVVRDRCMMVEHERLLGQDGLTRDG